MHGEFESLRIDRLGQVVNRLHVKSAYGVWGVGDASARNDTLGLQLRAHRLVDFLPTAVVGRDDDGVVVPSENGQQSTVRNFYRKLTR